MSMLLLLLSSRLPWWLRWYRIYLQCKRSKFNPWVGMIPWRREWLPTPLFLPGEIHGQRSLVGFHQWSHRVGHDWMTNTFSFPFHLLTFSILEKLCVLSESCLTLCDPMDCNPPGSSVHGISQERILEWAAISFSRWSSQHRCQTCISRVSCIGRWILYPCTTWEALPLISVLLLLIIFYPIDFILHFYLFSNGDGFWFL